MDLLVHTKFIKNSVFEVKVLRSNINNDSNIGCYCRGIFSLAMMRQNYKSYNYYSIKILIICIVIHVVRCG